MFLLCHSGKLHRSIIKLPWELVNQFSDVIVRSFNADDDSEDEDELEAYNDSIQRLKDADDVTRAMTREEYVHYSECRQASFTYRKSKRFREWANMSSFVEVKPNDDIVDSLGFLTYEMVSKLTMTAIKIKRDLMEAAGKKEDEPVGLGTGLKRKREEEEEITKNKRKREDDDNDATTPANTTTTIITTAADGTVSTPQQDNMETSIAGSDDENEKDTPGSPDSFSNGLFSLPSTEQTPLLPEHIYEAFRRLQQIPQPMKNFRGGLVRTRISLI